MKVRSLPKNRYYMFMVGLVLGMMSSAIFASQQVRIYESKVPVTASEPLTPPPPAVTSTSESLSSTQKQPVKAKPKPVKLSVDRQIQLIDAEILMLKAELARKNGNKDQVRSYLQEFDQKYSIPLPEKITVHIQELRQYLKTVESNQDVTESKMPESDFIFDDRKVVVLLPLSGPYQKIGEAIQKGLETQFSTVNLTFFDTQIYESMLQLWELVRLYQPTFIIGPLQKENARALSRLSTGIPTLYLNELVDKKAYERSFSLNRENHINALIEKIIQNHLESLTILVDESEASQRFLTEFKSQWKKRVEKDPESLNASRIRVQKVPGKVDQAVGKLVNGRDSLIRKNWLQKTVGRHLFFDERSRKDLDLVVSFLPERQAVQVAPLLKYFNLGFVQHYWLPSQLPSSEDFKKSLSFWRNTYAFLPKYFVQPLLSPSQKNDEDSQSEEIGTFYAFGELAAKIIVNMTTKKRPEFSSQLGDIRISEDKDPQIQPGLYWLNKGISPVRP